jgi:hypothetical protein
MEAVMSTKQKDERDHRRKFEALFARDQKLEEPTASGRPKGLIVQPPPPQKTGKGSV